MGMLKFVECFSENIGSPDFSAHPEPPPVVRPCVTGQTQRSVEFNFERGWDHVENQYQAI
tara:strand:+ start:1482 stop:1661 length:180 start_codon:yes stop_codon:yes gene_type:complete